MVINTQISPNVAQLNVFEPLIIAEDDEDSHVFVSQLYVNDEPLNIIDTSNYTAIFNYKRADGSTGSANCEITDGKVSVAVPDEALALDDYVLCNICIKRAKPVATHSLSVVDGQLVVTTNIAFGWAMLRTATFKIDSQLSVITA